MRYLLITFLIINIQACKDSNTAIAKDQQDKQQSFSYSNEVYEFLNWIYRKKATHKYEHQSAYLNINHNLNNSFDNINRDLLEKLLEQAKKPEYKYYIPDHITEIDSWQLQKTVINGSSFDQSNVDTEKIVFIDCDNNQLSKNDFCYMVDGIIFFDDFAIYSTNYKKAFYQLTLFKKQDNTYKQVLNVTDPELGTE
jgi:hypothetical protein